MLRNFLILILLSVNSLFSQNETANWYFGNAAGISFDEGNVNVRYDGSLISEAGCASMSDTNGNLLFYTNGETVWNSEHQIMINGNDLHGKTESIQSSIIVPNPEDTTIYYIFTTRDEVGNFFSPGVSYSVVEFTTENPLGEITEKNVSLINTSTEKITGIYLPEEDIYKIIAFGQEPYENVFGQPVDVNAPIDTLTFFNVTGSGVSVSSSVEIDEAYVNLANSGAMKVSPDGELLAIADGGQRRIYIFSLNASTDSVSYFKQINTSQFGGGDMFPYALEFSPNSEILYFTSSNNSINYKLFQFDLYNPAPNNDKITIANSVFYSYGALQLGLDGRIYLANYSTDPAAETANYLSVINKPNQVGATNCEFEEWVFDLSPEASYRGLPNFVQSYFENRIITENRCVSQAVDFEINAYAEVESVFWEFGDNNTSNITAPSHQFSSAGEYIVKASAEINGKLTTLYKKINVYPLPEVPSGITITQCDLDNDGISFFNLLSFESYIEDNESIEFELSFFQSLEDATNQENQISNAQAYQNSTNYEEIFVVVKDPKGCESISSFILESSYLQLENIPRLVVCEGSDGVHENAIGRFDLRPKRDQIKNIFNIPEDSIVTFFASLLDAQTETNPIEDAYNAPSSTIWVRVEASDGSCGGIGSFNLQVGSNLYLDIEDNYTICDSNLQEEIILNGGIIYDSWEWKNDLNEVISTQQYFTVDEIGNFSITGYKLENGIECSRTKEFTVEQSGQPNFVELMADNALISVTVTGESSYEFSLDNVTFFGQGLSHTFFNVEPGVYDVYVRDVENCETPIKQSISFIGLPKYITPNNDGINDVWQVEGISRELYKSANTQIFNRYGKLLYSMDINTNQIGWDGTYNNQMLPAYDYWYVVILVDADGNPFKHTGHFSIIR